MKKIKILILLVLAFNSLAFLSCTNKTAKNEDLIDQVDKFLSEGDYRSAYNIVDKIIADEDIEMDAYSLNKKIITAEIASVFEEEGISSRQKGAKLLLIIQERARYNDRYSLLSKRDLYYVDAIPPMYDEVINLAQSLGEDEIVDIIKSAKEQYKKTNDVED